MVESHVFGQKKRNAEIFRDKMNNRAPEFHWVLSRYAVGSTRGWISYQNTRGGR